MLEGREQDGEPGSAPRTASGAQAWLLALARQHRLSPTQRRVLQRLLDGLPEVSFSSAGEVAELAGVSQPTVTRLAVTLGFSGYQDFRRCLREALVAPPPATDEVQDRYGTAVEDGRAGLGALHHVVGGEALGRAVAALRATSPLGVVGLRASAALADHFGYFARRVLPAVHVLTDAGSVHDGVLELQQLGGTAVLVFAMPRYPDATVRAMRQAHDLGMATVVVVDTPLAPFAGDADALLVTPVGEGLVFDSHAAAVLLSTVLLDALASADPRRTQERLEAHEALVHHWVHPDR